MDQRLIKDAIIGGLKGYSDYNIVKPWVHSIKRSGFDGDIVIVGMDIPQSMVDQLRQDGVIVVEYEPESHHINVVRFKFIYDYLKNHTYRNVILSDVRDVIFQHNPTPYMLENIVGGIKIISGTEAIYLRDEPWGKGIIEETWGSYIRSEMDDFISVCAGVIAGEASIIKDLSYYIYMFAINHKRVTDGVSDQAAYNLLLNKYPWKDITLFSTLKDGFIVNAGTISSDADSHKYDRFLVEPKPYLNQAIKNFDGKEFIIVHQYERDGLWRDHFHYLYNT